MAVYGHHDSDLLLASVYYRVPVVPLWVVNAASNGYRLLADVGSSQYKT